MHNEHVRHATVNRVSGLPVLFAALAALLAIIFPAHADTWTDSPLLHNSNRFGTCSNSAYNGTSMAECEDPAKGNGVWTPTSKWGGEWGTDTGRYGGFSCETCHERGTENIKLFKLNVTSPDYPLTPLPCETPGRQGCDVSFQTTLNGGSDFGDDTGGHATSGKPCEICHSATKFHRYDTSGQTDLAHFNRDDCASACHSHNNGFRHGGGGGGNGCIECHGHDAGYVYETGKTGKGAGSFQSHSTHTENDDDDLKGPNLVCGDCHDTGSFPRFKDGRALSDTAVCNPCHSPGGAYDGVNNPVFGAKANWKTGVYQTDSATLQPGREKWCASCHDEASSVISGIAAPNVIGSESGAYTYGNGWGFYKTGHGLAGSAAYPASGGVTAGAGLECGSCHDALLRHIDGDSRSFGCGDGCDSAEYRSGYRLKLINGQNPMTIPLTGAGNTADQYRLCFSCHDSTPFLDAGSMNTNLVSSGTDGTKNRHEYHLNFAYQLRYPADYNYGGTINSRITCVTCHNVHGSTRPVMVNDGRLTGREPGLKMWYYRDGFVSYNPSSTEPPVPENIPLSASTGALLSYGSSANLCGNCHGNNNVTLELRTPFQNVQVPPTLYWTGEANYAADGVNPDSGPGGNAFAFRVKYVDTNNDAPATQQAWIDANDNGAFDAGEKHDMAAVDPGDNNYLDGRIYAFSLTLDRAGDRNLAYRFVFSDGAVAGGDPATDHQVVVTNAAPMLSWTGEANYSGDGVHPNTGGNGGNFVFRIQYTDLNNDPPAAIQVWVDANDNGVYEAGEKFSMTGTDSGDANYADGKLYSKMLALNYAGDGNINYRFYASDGFETAASDAGPVSDNTVAVTLSANNPPSLAWVFEECRADGVKPVMGLATGNFEFKVSYEDLDNEAPADIQVWVDENDNDSYEYGEKHNMNEADTGDTNYADGRLYSKTLALAYAGDGGLKYRFYASDGTDDATGAPAAADRIVTVMSTTGARGVRPGLETGPVWYGTIQGAINSVADNLTAWVYPGTYTERITLGSNDDNTVVKSVCGATATIIDANAGGIAVTFNNAVNAELNGFTVQNGANSGNAAGVYIWNNSSPAIRNSVIKNNTSTGNGAGVFITGTSAGATIENTTIANNTGTGGASNGGGINFSVSSGTLDITNSAINTNSARNGGAVFANSITGSIHISNTTMNGNTATVYHGGAVYLSAAPADITGGSVTNNTAQQHGGGIYSIDANLSLTGVTLSGNAQNSASQNGGAIYARGTGTHGIAINKCVVEGNSAAGNGGGMYLLINGSSPAFNLTNTIVSGNVSAINGGGVYLYNLVGANITNSTIAGNYATSSGGGVYCSNAGSTNIVNSIIWGNNSQIRQHTTGVLTVGYSDVWNSGSPWAGSGNINSDPLFIEMLSAGSGTPVAAGNFHIQSGSPAINAGTSAGAPSDDIDGDTRPSGGGIDMGADEQ